jgi:hypothetical protein
MRFSHPPSPSLNITGKERIVLRCDEPIYVSCGETYLTASIATMLSCYWKVNDVIIHQPNGNKGSAVMAVRKKNWGWIE